MAWDEWEQLKADALARQQPTGTQLNQLPTDGGGSAGTADLRTNVSGKAMAIKALQPDGIPHETKVAGRHAEENSDAAALEFKGWATAIGLKDAHDEWERQVENLRNRLEADRDALQGTKQGFQYVDLGVRSQIAQIDAGNDPRYSR